MSVEFLKCPKCGLHRRKKQYQYCWNCSSAKVNVLDLYSNTKKKLADANGKLLNIEADYNSKISKLQSKINELEELNKNLIKDNDFKDKQIAAFKKHLGK